MANMPAVPEIPTLSKTYHASMLDRCEPGTLPISKGAIAWRCFDSSQAPKNPARLRWCWMSRLSANVRRHSHPKVETGKIASMHASCILAQKCGRSSPWPGWSGQTFWKPLRQHEPGLQTLLIHGSCWSEQVLLPGQGRLAGSSVPAQISCCVRAAAWRLLIDMNPK